MKYAIYLIIIGIAFSCSSIRKVNKPRGNIIKSITEASYSTKRIDEMTRREALKHKINRKELYNEKGELVMYMIYEIDGTLFQRIELTRNKDGKIIKRLTYDKYETLKNYMTTEFDDKGNIAEYKTFDSNDKLIRIQKNEYDNQGNRVLMTNTNVETNRTLKTTFEYNSKDQLKKETDYYADDTIKDIRTFKYDEKGNETESEISRSNGDYTKFVSEYDKLNNLIVQNWYDLNGKQKHQTSFTYVYNNNGIWVTKKRFSNGKLGYVWERKIEYF